MNGIYEQSTLDPLTERELEILRLIADGLSNEEIADTLVVAASTVKWYNKQIYSKLGVHSRTQAAARAREMGVLEEELSESSLSVPLTAPAAQAGHPLIGSRFALHTSVASGAMGTVYRAVDTHTGEIVAVKALDLGLVVSEPEMLVRFIREGEALRELNHPNIVKMLATVAEEGRHYIVMEYVGGGSLRELLDRETALPLSRALGIALELADALSRAHHLKIIHRDLKPGNVLLTKDGTPRLTDFGTARVINQARITRTGAAVGTPEYLSPEALDGREVDTRTDVWSFGVMLFEMLAGEHPFSRATLADTMMAIATQPLPDLVVLRPEVPDALVGLVHWMLEKNREERLPSMRLVGVVLEAIIEGRDSATSPPR